MLRCLRPFALTLCTTASLWGLTGLGAGCADNDDPAPPDNAGSASMGEDESALVVRPIDTRPRRCRDDAECGRGRTCDKKSCDAKIGLCVDRPFACPDVWQPQCGCDGKTYGNACERRAAAVDLAHEGECEVRCGGLAGIPCPDGMVCIHEPGTCQIMDGFGTCVDKPAVCTKELAPVCGCDGQTYDNRCEATAAGVSIASKGECESHCGWNGDCHEGDYCSFENGECGGKGTCEPRPGVCPLYYRPVCGCDGKTYGNECEAAAAGVSVTHAGECVVVCDGIAGVPCAKGQFCDHKAGECDISDAQGSCVEIPEACGRYWQPVCGCDGQTYGSDCLRIQAGVQKSHEGACADECKETADCPDPDHQICKQEGCDVPGVCVERPFACTKEYAPVCGCDGETYGNACTAALHGVTVLHTGACYCGARMYGCDEGEFCEWPVGQCDIADNIGECVEIPRVCTDEWMPVCGCDGVTYGNDCDRRAAGVQKAKEGPCEVAECKDNAQCKDTEWCARATCDGVGSCQVRPTACFDDWDPVCGCDGVTYSNKCYAAAKGVVVEHEGECRVVCGGIFGVPCKEREFCDPFPGECQIADGQGTCVPKGDICLANYKPVCGCDGVTYSNDCHRIGAGVGKDHDGRCECAPVLCDMWCQYGFQVDEFGCEICACNPPPTCCDPKAEPDCFGTICCGDGKWHCGALETDPALVPVNICGELGEGKVCDICQPVACDLFCPWGYQVNADGCEICACNPPPQCCDPAEKPGPATGTWCYEGATCCADGKWHCNDATAEPVCGSSGEGKVCGCEPVACDLWCEYGFKVDENGCEICECNPKPECPPLCDMFCRYGNKIDPVTGCELCECNPAPTCCDPKNAPTCPGEEPTCCDNGRWWCSAMMGPMACVAGGEVCKDECPGVMCTLYCEYGFEVGPDGCEICDCKEPPTEACCDAKAEPACQHGATCCAGGEWVCNRIDLSSVCREKAEVCPVDASTP